ncbi:MAG: hypothetical protein AB7O67_21230 [Vicinamibacterales bacterium]
MTIRAAELIAFYLFDVAESVDLAAVPALVGAGERARLQPKPPLPAYVGFQRPPVQLDAESLGLGPIAGGHVRFKIYEYGIVSVSVTRGFAGSWGELVDASAALAADHTLEDQAEAHCRALVSRITAALDRPRADFLSEDYFVFAVSDIDGHPGADQVLADRGDQIARLLRGETAALAPQEREEVLRHRLSYLTDDLVVPAWAAAFVYDTPAGIQAALEILEYANSQLLQFRYYDERLDAELTRIYKELESSRTYVIWRPHRYVRAARQVHAIFIDVNELTDRTENALKLVGDVYAARLLALANQRLGVTGWRASVQEKLKTLDEIYRFAVDQTAMERGEVLELAIVVILVFELILFFMGIMT